MIRLLIGTIFIFCGTFSLVAAQGTAEFNIRLFGAEDTEAPASTTISSVVPVSASQIDLEWATSTDNYTVFGYVVFRDGSAIATTTALSYSDTGLTASTSYSYTVFAFDGVPNYSSSSDAVATTTPDLPPIATSTPTTTSSGTRLGVALDDLEIAVGTATASVAVQTNRPVRIEIRIGETSSYELGYIVGNVFAAAHIVPINDLRPETRYYYEIVAYTPWGTQTTLRTGSFMTLSDAAPAAPTNVSEFTATPTGQSVELQWQMPADLPRDAVVRIVRSHYGYPLFINDGVVVYEGSAESTQDAGVLGSYDRVYYTAFVIDPNGLISSGALAQVSVLGTGAPGSTTNQPGQVGTSPGDDSKETAVETEPDPIPFNSDMPEKAAIVVTQTDLAYTFASSSIPLSGAEVFTVSVPATAIVGDFKTIIATLSDPRGSGKTFSFLLRLNADRTSYEATIAPVRVNGSSALTVEVYDYDALVMARYTTQIAFSGVEQTASSTIEQLLYQLASWLWASLLAVPFIVLFTLWFIFWRRAQEEQL